MKPLFVDPQNARKGQYQEVINEISLTGKCPFCPEHFKYHKKPILRTQKNWFLTENSWPYKNSRCHFLIIGKKHKEKFSQLTANDFKEVSLLANWAIKKYDIQGGAVIIRFGDTHFTGASVAHLHFHLISPQTEKHNSSKRVIFPIGG